MPHLDLSDEAAALTADRSGMIIISFGSAFRLKAIGGNSYLRFPVEPTIYSVL
jgi:hypothetical protein